MNRFMRLAGLLAVATVLLCNAAAGAPWGADATDFSLLPPEALVDKAQLKTRLTEFERAAAQGDVDAQTLLGIARLYGFGVAKDERTAATLFRVAAEAGHSRAMNGWAVVLDNGIGGVAKDPAQARVWMQRGAEAGNALAMLNLAAMLERGSGGPADPVAAAGWVRRAAEQGLVPAMTRLGMLLDAGDGVARDSAAAVTWFHRAAQRGDVDAMNNLGVMLSGGRGGKKDETEAEHWFRAGANAGHSQALRNLVALLLRRTRSAVEREGITLVLFLRFTSSTCETCRKADSAWAEPEFQKWLHAAAMSVTIDIDKASALAKELGVTAESLLHRGQHGSSRHPVVVIEETGKARRAIWDFGQVSPKELVKPYVSDGLLIARPAPIDVARRAAFCRTVALRQSNGQQAQDVELWTTSHDLALAHTVVEGNTLRALDFQPAPEPKPEDRAACAADLEVLGAKLTEWSEQWAATQKQTAQANRKRRASQPTDPREIAYSYGWCSDALIQTIEAIRAGKLGFDASTAEGQLEITKIVGVYSAQAIGWMQLTRTQEGEIADVEVLRLWRNDGSQAFGRYLDMANRGRISFNDFLVNEAVHCSIF